jgi:hypothetical protein
MVILYSKLNGGQIRQIPVHFENLVELNRFVRELKERYQTKVGVWDVGMHRGLPFTDLHMSDFVDGRKFIPPLYKVDPSYCPNPNGDALEGNPVLVTAEKAQELMNSGKTCRMADPPWLRDWSKSVLLPGRSSERVAIGKLKHEGPSLLRTLMEKSPESRALDMIEDLKRKFEKTGITPQLILMGRGVEAALIEECKVEPHLRNKLNPDDKILGLSFVVLDDLPRATLFLTTEKEGRRIISQVAGAGK